MDQKQILIIGANGQLGTALKDKYPNARAVDADSLDITDRKAVQEYDWTKVKYIHNAAAYTNVDGAETKEGRITAWQVNAVGAANMAKIAQERGITFIHISTDYVFDGRNELHTELEPFSPLSVYGESKAAGDIAVSMTSAHYLLRTSWVIGEGKNFVRTMLDLASKGISPTVVADQIGRPTFTSTLVDCIDYLLTNKADYGTYNISNGGEAVSWADLTRHIFNLTNSSDLTVTNTTTDEYFATKPESAPRPLNSMLDLSKIEAIGFKPKDWQSDLGEYLKKELQK